MTMARAQLVDVAVTRWYHCVARCVRGASLLSAGATDRKQWVESRLEELAQVFAISVGAFAVLDDRIHILLRVDPDITKAWSGEEVVRRYGRLFPPRGKRREQLPVSSEWVRAMLKDAGWVASARERLQSLGWFMKCLKEPLSRLANRQDDTRGFFFEGRFKTVAILDEESLIATCVYIDLTPVAAGTAAGAEASAHTSLRQRIKHLAAEVKAQKPKPGRGRRVAGKKASAGLKESFWICPIEDSRAAGSAREGMLENFTLENYRLLARHTGKLFRTGSAPASRDVTAMLDRLGTNATAWEGRLTKLREGRLLGSNFAASRARLQEVANLLGVRKLANLAACPVR
jgi:hypothetical protein